MLSTPIWSTSAATSGMSSGCAASEVSGAHLVLCRPGPNVHQVSIAKFCQSCFFSSWLSVRIFVQHLAQRPGGTLRGLFRRCTAHVDVRDTGAKVLFCKTLPKTTAKEGLIAKTLLARLVRLRTAMPASGAWSHERKRAASRRRRPQPSRHPARQQLLAASHADSNTAMSSASGSATTPTACVSCGRTDECTWQGKHEQVLPQPGVKAARHTVRPHHAANAQAPTLEQRVAAGPARLCREDLRQQVL